MARALLDQMKLYNLAFVDGQYYIIDTLRDKIIVEIWRGSFILVHIFVAVVSKPITPPHPLPCQNIEDPIVEYFPSLQQYQY